MVSKYFNNYNRGSEQDLIEDLYAESIHIHGLDVFYIPRQIDQSNETFREATVTQYNQALETECYLASFDSYGGEGAFLSRFGLEFRDEITLEFATRTFKNDIGQYLNIDRPQSGDLIYFPIDKNLFQIMEVKVRDPFFQLGKLYKQEVIAQLFEYSNETFATGIPEIDDVYNAMDFREDINEPIPDIDDSILNTVDEQSMNQYFQEQANTLIDEFSTDNPFGDP